MPTTAVAAPVSKSQERARRSANADKYAPRVRAVAPVAAAPKEDPRLRKLTAQVLEELKHPGAIPSRVVMAALAQAQALGRA